jgi:hypothetical protein
MPRDARGVATIYILNATMTSLNWTLVTKTTGKIKVGSYVCSGSVRCRSLVLRQELEFSTTLFCRAINRWIMSLSNYFPSFYESLSFYAHSTYTHRILITGTSWNSFQVDRVFGYYSVLKEHRHRIQ